VGTILRLSLGRPGRLAGLVAAISAAGLVAGRWDDLAEKRVAVVAPGRAVRGAWQRPGPLRRVIAREGIRTIVTLTAINQDDPKYVDQAAVVRETGVRWILVPMRGSRATIEQMAEAADLIADPGLQPVFFHCVAGHHRSSLAHAAYRVRHDGWDAARAWAEVSALPWARPSADGDDRRLIEEFAASRFADGARFEGDTSDEARPIAEVGPAAGDRGGGDRGDGGGLELRHRELRPGDRGPGVPVGPAEPERAGAGHP